MEIIIKDKTFVPYLTHTEIALAVKKVAAKLNENLKNSDPIFICVLNGAFMFAADLMKNINFYSEISFVKISSYEGTSSTGQIKQLIGLGENLSGRDVIILEDIIDTGLTMNYLLKEVEKLNPASVHIATLLFKPEPFQGDFEIPYIGFEIPNKFVVGYGLDYDGLGRNLPDIYQLKN